MKKLVCVILCLAAMFSLSAAAAGGTEAVEHVTEGIVRVLVMNPNTQQSAVGTGFFVGPLDGTPEILVTNRHVVEGMTEYYLVLEDTEHTDTIIPAELIISWSSPDLAILRASRSVPERVNLPLLPSANVSRLEQVYAVGFPYAADTVQDKGDLLPSHPADATITSGIISKQLATVEGANTFQIDADINGGNSGGPLVNGDGCVIGINTWGALNSDQSAAAGTNYSIYIDYVIKYMDEQGLPYAVGKTAEGSTLSTQTPGGPSQSTAPDNEEKRDGATGGGIPAQAYYLIGLAVVVLAVSLVALAVRKKKAAPPPVPVQVVREPDPRPVRTPQPVPSPAVAEPAEEARPAVVYASSEIAGVSGHFAYQRFPVADRILFGRDPAVCTLVYPDKTPGVSAVHCELRRVGTTLELTDRGSSYGTFLGDGTRLEVNKPYVLRKDEQFYLGDSYQRFTAR